MLPWCQHLVRLGSQVTVQTNDPRALAAVSAVGARGERVNGIVHPIRPVADCAGAIRLARWMRGGRFDIVHTHTSKGGFLGRLAARIAGVPVIIHTVHNFAFHEYSPAWQSRLYSTLERIAARWCDRLIFVSREHAAWARQLGIGDDGKVMSIVNAVRVPDLPTAEQARAARARLGFDDDTPIILCVGRLCPAKNYGDMVRAMVHLAARYPAAQLLIAGEGPLRQQLEKLIRTLNAARWVRLLGFRTDVPDLMAAADVVAFSSLWEGMPLAMLEAMAAAKPVVANAIMGVREVIQDGATGLLVPPRRPDKMATAIATVLDQPQAARTMGLNARRQVMAEHSMQSFLEGYENVYRELVRAKVLGSASAAWQRDGYVVECRRR